MSNPVVGHSAARDHPEVRGQLVVEVATVVRIPTCPLTEPKRQFLVRLMSSSARVALRQGVEVAAQGHLGRTWGLGLTWGPASYSREKRIFVNDAGEVVGGDGEEANETCEE